MTPGDGTESRLHARAPVACRVRLTVADQEDFAAKFANNISEGGVFVEAHTERLPGDQLTITLVQPETGEEIALDGTVAAVQVPPGKIRGLGIRFLPLSAEEREQHRRFIFGRDE